MGAQVVWIPTPIYVALVQLQMNDFTPIECVNAVYGTKREPNTHKMRYRLVYNHLNRLVNMGLLKRKVTGDLYYANFVKTHRFYEVNFQEHVAYSENKETANVAQLKALREKASRYHSHINEYFAEWLEYKALQEDFPELERVIKEELDRSYKNFQVAQGKLSAVSSVIRAITYSDNTKNG